MRIPLAFVAVTLAAGLWMAGARAQTPPATWQEHWFEHNQLITREYYDNDIAIYFDDGFTESEKTAALAWMVPYVSALWNYVIDTYGDFGAENRLYAIFHDGRYSGGHPSTYIDAHHDFRNVADCGPGGWTTPSIDIFTHEVGHIVEIANNGVLRSPAFNIWGDSKWAEIFQYDCYIGMGRTSDAQRLYNSYIDNSDDFPRENTYWFRDWYYPIWRDYGKSKVLSRFFKLLAANFPSHEYTAGGQTVRRYDRGDMNMGEYVYFMSAAARTDLRKMAREAFGWTDEWAAEFAAAKAQWPEIYYTGKDITTAFGKKPQISRVRGKYRVKLKIRDNNGIRKVTMIAAGRKLKARLRGGKYIADFPKKPRAVKVLVQDRRGDETRKRFKIR